MFFLGCLSGGCNSGNPLREVALGISAAATVGRVASLVVAANGGQAACVAASQSCTNFPCDTSATITLGADCPLPLGGAASGTISVTAHFTSANDATLSATLESVAITGGKNVALADVTQITATRSGNMTSVQYTGSNAQARSGADSAAVGAASNWDVTIDSVGTDAASDDRLAISATSAAASAGLGTSAKTLTLSDVVVDPSCALNPISGSGSQTEVSGFIPSIDQISFHSACDGKALFSGNLENFDLVP